MAEPLRNIIDPGWAEALEPVAGRIAAMGEFLRAEVAAGRGIRVLADDEHAHAVERLLERPQHVLARRQVAAPGRDLRPQELAHRGDPARDGLECLGPARVDDVAQRLRHGQHCIGGYRQNRYRTGPVSRPGSPHRASPG